MKAIRIAATEYKPLNRAAFVQQGMDPGDLSAFEKYLQTCCPDLINRSAIRRKEQIPLVMTPSRGAPCWNGCLGVFHTLFPPDSPKYDITIQINSRFDTENKHYFFAALLQSWVESHAHPVNFGSLVTECSWDEIIGFLTVSVFRQQLMTAYESGIYRAYQYFEDNSGRLRGSIDVPRHIRRNLGMTNGKIAVRYRENTPDNAMNHLILHTYHTLKQRYPTLVSALIERDSSKGILDHLRYLAPSYPQTHAASTAARLRQPISNPLYEDYEHLRDTCIRILNDLGISVFDYGTEQVNTILFYSPDLWEHFLEKRIFSRLDTGKPDSQARIVCVNGLELRPDFVFFNGKLVLDAKYKEKWKDFPQAAEIEADLRQCLVYYAVLQAEYTGVVIPVQEPMEAHQRRQKISPWDRKEGGSFRVFDVWIPPGAGDSYHVWRKKLAESEAETANRVASLCREITGS